MSNARPGKRTEEVRGRQQLLKQLNDTRGRLIARTAKRIAKSGHLLQPGTPERLAYLRRRGFIEELRGYIEDDPVPPLSVFISYSKRTGQRQLEVVQSLCNKAGIEVVTGFDDDVQKEEETLRMVTNRIRSQTLFMSIMTPMVGQNYPSPWVTEEKGMALAMGKPFRLLVDEKIDKGWWSATTPNKLHSVYNSTNFPEVARQAVEALLLRYEALMDELFAKGNMPNTLDERGY